MIRLKRWFILLLALFTGSVFYSCKDKWEEHNAITDQILTENLLSQLKLNADVSIFYNLLVKSGYDKVVASSKTFTIWAPNNQALQTLDPAIVSDTAKLKKFVANHISNQAYFTREAVSMLTIRSLNGKNVQFTSKSFEEAGIVLADQVVGNGVYHVIDRGIVPKLNAWEFLNNSATSLLKDYLVSLNYTYMDSSRAVVIGVDPKTGAPIYQPGTGLFQRNTFLQRVSDLSNEDRQSTFIMLNDAAFTSEMTKLTPYFLTGTPDSTSGLVKWNVVKDLAFRGAYTLDNLPDTLTSNDSVRIHIDKSAVVSVQKVSNGVVYIVNKIDYKLGSKIRPVIIQGERPTGFLSTKTWSVRTRRYPNTLIDFQEIYMENTATSAYWVQYKPIVNAVKYKVYWLAPRDFNLTGTITYFQQKVVFGVPTATTFAYQQINLLNFNEVYLGEYTAPRYGTLGAYLVGFTSTTNGQNTLVLDYIKMVPVLQ